MDSLYPVIQIATYILMALCVFAAFGAVSCPNLFHAALCLVGVLIGIAGIYLTLQAEFLAIVQILLYVGAVMTIVIFAIMMTNRFGSKNTASHNKLGIPALFASTALFLVLAKLLARSDWPVRAEAFERVSVETLGKAFVGPYVFPFEVISIILISAMIGALIVAKRDKEEA